MAIDRTAYNALVDDDGSNTVGTPINKLAIKNVLLDPIDLAINDTGVWTPSLGGTATYTARSATYTKVGRLVHVRGNLQINAIGTGAVGTISGLPFAAAFISPGCIGFFQSPAGTYVFVGCYVSGSTIIITSLGAAGASPANPSTFFANGTYLDFSATYHV